ncbi:MAG TPA: methyltransferase domain-containing protein [Gaiellaceae bacterium]|nr:methyltransferase domain-containing protein [Gaiellaceae bacterium]
MARSADGKRTDVTARGASAAARALDRARERARFVRAFLSSPREVGALLPTSRRTVRAMLDLAPVERARLVVELGAGTGVHTREILRRLPPEGRLLAFEIDAALADALAAELRDPRLRVVAESAANVEAHLDGEHADVIVSAVPFTSIGAAARREILDASRRALAEDGTMLVLQYSPLMRRELERVFASVERRLSLLNVPPAVLFACRGSRAAAP